MTPVLRNAILVAAACLLYGCASDPSLTADIRQTRLQAEALNQRVDRLETSRSVGSTAYADTGTTSGTGTDSSVQGADTSFRAGGAVTKLGRGAVNTVTGWVEVPKRIHETSQRSGPWAGLTWGLLRGLGYGFIRTAGGVYEVVTFPFPAPPGYRPVMRPEYVFLPDTE